MMTRIKLVAPLALTAIFIFSSGCASKRIVSQWSNPDYANLGAFKRIMVVGVTDQDAIRRNFEDRFVRRLGNLGVEALPSYRFIKEPQAPPQREAIDSRLKAAVQQAKADAVLVTRLMRVEQQTDITPGYFAPSFGLGYSRWHSPGWFGADFYYPPRVHRYPVFYSETTLYDANQNEVVWTGTIRTIDPDSADEAIDDYIATVVGALKSRERLRG